MGVPMSELPINDPSLTIQSPFIFLCTCVLAHSGILYSVYAIGKYNVCRSTTLHSRNILLSHSL